jgi:hypothetical protein
MSGEAVVVSSVVGTVGAGAVFALSGFLVVGSIAYQMAKSHHEKLEADALLQANKHKNKLAAWHHFQQDQQTVMQHLHEEREIARQAFADLCLQVNDDAAQQDDFSPESGANVRAQATGFLDKDESTQVQQRLEQLQTWLTAVPAQLSLHEKAPIAVLQQQLEQFNQTPPRMERLEQFTDTAHRSVQKFIQQLEETAQLHNKILQQAETELDTLLSYQHLAESGTEAEEIAALQAHLLAILATEDQTETKLSALALLQKKSALLQGNIKQRLEHQAAEATIYQRVHHHMQAMGYEATQQTGERVHSWTIPNGEQVRFSLQSDFKLSFQVAHERTQHTDAALSLQERAFLHQQENKWCKDLPRLLKHLKADGLAYEVGFERQLPDDSIPIVVLETVDELLEAEEKSLSQQKSSVKRYLTP